MPKGQPRYPCTLCGFACSDTKGPSSIGCDVCERWSHRRCVPLHPHLFAQWNEDNMSFVCRECAFKDGEFDVQGSLKRIAGSQDKKAAAKSELLLCTTYDVHLPPVKPVRCISELSHAAIDHTARSIIQLYQPVILHSHQPLRVAGDGNCFYRAVSLAVFGCVSYHPLLRLFVAFEVLLHQEYYDCSRNDYVDIFKDNRIVLENFGFFVENVLKLGGYACMHAMSATSAVLEGPVRSYCPPNRGNFFDSDPLTRVVVGRGVRRTKQEVCFLMWSMMIVPTNHDNFRPNHFAFLCSKSMHLAEQISINDDVGDDDNRKCGADFFCNDDGSATTTAADDANPEEKKLEVEDDSGQADYDNEDDNGDSDEDGVVNVDGDNEDGGCGVGGDNHNDDDIGGDDCDFDGSCIIDSIDRGDNVDDDHGDNADDHDVCSINGSDNDDDGDDYACVGVDNYNVDKGDVGGENWDDDDDVSVGWDSYVDDVGHIDDNDDDDDDDEEEEEEEEEVVFNDNNQDPVNIESGGQLPNGKFLELHDLYKNITKPDSQPLDSIPYGKKDNVFFVVKNINNLDRRAHGRASQFADDRGAWKSDGSSTKTFLLRDEWQFRVIYKRNDIFCRQLKVDKVKIFLPLEPQPTNVITLHRYYVKHTANPGYEKRVSWFEYPGAPECALHEYKGTCPDPKPHGRTTIGNPGNYCRLLPQKMEKMKQSLTTLRPTEVYNQDKSLNGPRNIKQVYNAKSRIRASCRPEGTHASNFADQVDLVEHMQHGMPFIKQIVKQQKKSPCFILYTEEQLLDLKRNCSPPPSAQSTVLGVDKTFNLGPLHATVIIFKNLSLKRRSTDDHPLFLGPIFLHGNSDTETFQVFFQHIAGRLPLNILPTLGSDDEKALREALARAFPGACRLTCTRHAKQNLNALLTDKVGLPKSERKKAVNAIFGKDGILATEKDPAMVSDILQHIAESSGNEHFTRHIRKLAPAMIENVRALNCQGLQIKNALWTNNNCESYNHVLKQSTGWKRLKLADLIQQLYSLVQGQYRESRRAFVGIGNYELSKPFLKFRIAKDLFYTKTAKQRDLHFRKFLSTVTDVDIVRSLHTAKAAQEPKQGGKKPGQKKRPRADKTNQGIPKRSRMT